MKGVGFARSPENTGCPLSISDLPTSQFVHTDAVTSRILSVWLAGLVSLAAMADVATNRLALNSLSQARFDFTGPVGERLHANLENWLLCAPQANPGMLEMFRVRDRQPEPQLVPWAGEFVGKYLISAVQALRLSPDPRLGLQVSNVVARLMETQAEDGYLGPYPRKVRLLRNWDLWGHYHVIQALLLWHEQTGDPKPLASARRAGDLVCRTYLDTGKRVLDAGDPEMNMAILTAMAMLHRITGEARYLRMAQEVEKDWERAGDYLRSGLDGREFYQSPRPRWESLHDLQGLVELWQLTGESKYREAFEHHWRSIRRWDRRNTGGFSSGEQATGNPYGPGAIETCCTVAWMALTIDYLKLTADSRAADDLELATLNAGLGAQHPSGRWFTYSTPMDGIREASAHSIVFQARAGTPELNCCSVNGPRVPGMLSDWALMKTSDGFALNWLGAGTITTSLAEGKLISFTSNADAWRSGHTEIQVGTLSQTPFTLRLRIPAWAVAPKLRLNGQPISKVVPGSYALLRHDWIQGDKIELSFELPLRFIAGANEVAGKVSLYRGPLLLAYDQAHNSFDEDAIPALNLDQLAETRVMKIGSSGEPWLLLELPTAQGGPLRLVDFANAGATGTHYRSWLAAEHAPAAPAFSQKPADGARVPPGLVSFKWRGSRRAGIGHDQKEETSFRLELASNDAFSPVLLATNISASNQVILNLAQLNEIPTRPPGVVFWRVVSLRGSHETIPDVPPSRFLLDPQAPPIKLNPVPKTGPNGVLISHSLRSEAQPVFGELQPSEFKVREADGTEVNGLDQMLRYAVPIWPDEDFTVALRVRLTELHPGQIFSAWAQSMDDPLRLTVEGGKLFARIESGAGYSTPGAALEVGRWYQVAAVKSGGQLTLLVDGHSVGSCTVPESLPTRAADCALGGNPHFAGKECLAARFADFYFFNRALTKAEIQGLATK